MSTIVKTSYGSLKGSQKVSQYDGTKYFSYQGVPYAKPPVGNLRFKDPQELEPWLGVREALNEGNRAPHFDYVTKSFCGDEDCLFLNIYVPNTAESHPLPVMVWIHGGGFAYGHGDADVYGPEYLMGKNVILVTINYRLGALGFLNLGIPEAPGNMAMKDQTVAIKWITKEISKFGGDPKNITLFGESAGGASVHYHMLSPLSKGLFQKSIIQSGSSLCNWAFTKKITERAFALGKLLGCDSTDKNELLKFFHTVSPKTLASFQDKVITQDEHLEGTDQAFVLSVDGDFLPEEPLELLKKGLIYDVPTMVGIVSHEGFLMYASIAKIPSFVEQINKNLKTIIPYPIEKSEQVADLVRQKYFQGKDIDFKKHEEDFIQLYTHTLFLLPTMINLKCELSYPTRRTSPIYFYKFSYEGKLGWFKRLYEHFLKKKFPPGVSHVDEVGYLLSNSVMDSPATPEGSDREVVEKMTTMWTNFAKTGNPNPRDGATIWSPIESFEKFNYLEITSSQNMVMKQDLDKERIGAWLSKL